MPQSREQRLELALRTTLEWIKSDGTLAGSKTGRAVSFSKAEIIRAIEEDLRQ